MLFLVLVPLLTEPDAVPTFNGLSWFWPLLNKFINLFLSSANPGSSYMTRTLSSSLSGITSSRTTELRVRLLVGLPVFLAPAITAAGSIAGNISLSVISKDSKGLIVDVAKGINGIGFDSADISEVSRSDACLARACYRPFILVIPSSVISRIVHLASLKPMPLRTSSHIQHLILFGCMSFQRPGNSLLQRLGYFLVDLHGRYRRPASLFSQFQG